MTPGRQAVGDRSGGATDGCRGLVVRFRVVTTDSTSTDSTFTDSSPAPGGSSAGASPVSALLLETWVWARAALVGLAAALVAALGVLALLLAASVAGADVDDVASDVDSDDGLLNLLALPVQAVGMGLFGRLQIGDGGFGATLYLPLWWVTAAFVAGTWWWARRTERRLGPSRAVEQARAAALVAIPLALLLLLAMRVLALRDSGTVLHTASPSLFFGALLLTFGALWAGRWSVSPRWPAGLDPDVVVASRLLATGVLAWVLATAPVVFVLAWLEDGFGAALALLTVQPTIGLYLYELGHLVGVQALGETVYAWSGDGLLALALVLAGLVTVLATGLAWHLRRVRAGSPEPVSWVALPAVFLGGGFVLWVACLLVASGELGLFGGSLTIQPAVWSMFLLALWGLVAEIVSRYVAPGVVPALPVALRRRLEHAPPRRAEAAGTAPSAAATTAAGPRATAAEPMSPEQRARARRLALLGGGALVGVIALGIAWSVVNSQVFGPEGRAQAYLDAVAEADLETVAELAPFDQESVEMGSSFFLGDASDTGTSLFTEEVYDGAADRVTAYELEEVTVNGDEAVAEVRLEGLPGKESASLRLVRSGGRYGIFDDWTVAGGGLASVLEVELPEEATGSQVNGVDVDLDSSSQWVLPGTYRVDPYAGSRWLAGDAPETTVAPDEGYAFADTGEPGPSEELLAAVQEEVDAWLEECAASDDLEPDGCPMYTWAWGDDVRNVAWEITEPPELEDAYLGGGFPAEFYYGGGQATVTYEEDQSLGFGRPDFEAQESSSDLYFSVTVDVVDDEVQVSFDE